MRSTQHVPAVAAPPQPPRHVGRPRSAAPRPVAPGVPPVVASPPTPPRPVATSSATPRPVAPNNAVLTEVVSVQPVQPPPASAPLISTANPPVNPPQDAAIAPAAPPLVPSTNPPIDQTPRTAIAQAAQPNPSVDPPLEAAVAPNAAPLIPSTTPPVEPTPEAITSAAPLQVLLAISPVDTPAPVFPSADPPVDPTQELAVPSDASPQLALANPPVAPAPVAATPTIANPTLAAAFKFPQADVEVHSIDPAQGLSSSQIESNLCALYSGGAGCTFYALVQGIDPRLRNDEVYAEFSSLTNASKIFAPVGQVYISNDAREETYLYIFWIIEVNCVVVVEKLQVSSFKEYLAMTPPPLWQKDSTGQPNILLSPTLSPGLQWMPQEAFSSSHPDADMSTLSNSYVLAPQAQVSPAVAKTPVDLSLVDDPPVEDESIGGVTFGEMPSTRFEDEKLLSNYLSVLYTHPFQYLERRVMVGGRKMHLKSFHYPPENDEGPRNRKKREYIDGEEKATLYFYELKAALTTTALQVRIAFYRLYFAYHFIFYLSTDGRLEEGACVSGSVPARNQRKQSLWPKTNNSLNHSYHSMRDVSKRFCGVQSRNELLRALERVRHHQRVLVLPRRADYVWSVDGRERQAVPFSQALL